MGRVRWAWRFPAPIRAAASFSSPTPPSRTSTAPTPCSAESWPVWQCSRASPRATASAAFTADAAVGLERAAPPRGPPGGGAGPVRLLRAEQDPVPQLRLARAARRARGPLFLSGRGGARSRGARLRRRGLWRSGGRLDSPPPAPRAPDHLPLAPRIRDVEGDHLRA